MKSYFVLMFVFVMLFCTVFASAQCPETLWTRSLGVTGTEYAFDFCFNGGDSMVIVGREYVLNPNGQMYILMLTATGDTAWIQYYGSRVGIYPKAIVVGQIGEYYVIGAGGGATTVKINAVGDTVWGRNFLAPDDADVDPYNICYAAEGGCAVVCRRIGIGPHLAILRYSEDGELLWYHCYGGSSLDYPCGIHQTADGGYLLVSSTYDGENSTQVYLVRVNAQGDSLWSRSVGGLDTESPQGSCLTADGGAIIVGQYWYYESGSDLPDGFAVRVDSLGQPIWWRVMGGYAWDGFWAGEQTHDGNFICAGTTRSYSSGGVFWLAKLSAVGDSLWSCRWGGNWAAYSVHQARDGGYGAVGSGGNADAQGIVVRTVAEASVLPEDPTYVREFMLGQNYPNPFNARTTISYELPQAGVITLDIFTLLGSHVETLFAGHESAGSHAVIFDAADLSSGVYWCRLQCGSRAEAIKMVVLK
jgi:hypothetical protein